MIVGQAPGIVEGVERRPWRGRAGQTLRRWLDMDEERFYSTFYCSSVTRCYPGRHPSGRGDRPPSPRELELCRFWLEWELRLLQTAARRPRGRARDQARARHLGTRRLHRLEVRARRCDRGAVAAPIRRERLAQLVGKPQALGGGPCAPSGGAVERRSARRPLPHRSPSPASSLSSGSARLRR